MLCCPILCCTVAAPGLLCLGTAWSMLALDGSAGVPLRTFQTRWGQSAGSTNGKLFQHSSAACSTTCNNLPVYPLVPTHMPACLPACCCPPAGVPHQLPGHRPGQHHTQLQQRRQPRHVSARARPVGVVRFLITSHAASRLAVLAYVLAFAHVQHESWPSSGRWTVHFSVLHATPCVWCARPDHHTAWPV